MTDAVATDDPLAALPLLAGLDAATRGVLAQCCRPRLLAAGEVLFCAGDEADAVYFVQSGTLVAYLDAADGRREAVARIVAGEAVGEMALITGKPRSTHVAALRDARLLALSCEDFERILAHHPDAMLAFARGMAHRLDAANHAMDRPRGRTSTIALLPLAGGVDAAGLADALCTAVRSMPGYGRAISLDAAADGFGEALEAAESTRDCVLLHAASAGPGDIHDAAQAMDRAARHADLRLLSVDCRTAPPPAASLATCPALRGLGDFQRVELVLCHGDVITPGAAAMWLAGLDDALRIAQPGLRRGRLPHHHVRRTGAAAAADIARLARFALGRATGIVLSGGGARGFAHLGVMRALAEAGVAIDCIAGTSIGAIMGASAAQQWSHAEQLERFRRTFAVSDPLGDWTLPCASLVRGRRVSSRLRAVFGDVDILDLPVPFCCVSADLDAGAVRLHREGTLWRALRATCAIPGLLPPVVDENEVLVDGGILDNFPIDALHGWRPALIIGVDIASDDRLQAGGDAVDAPAWWDLRGWRAYRRSAPALPQLLVGAAMVGSRSAKSAGRAAVDLLFEPPLPGVGILDWRAFDRIVEAGYAHARTRLTQSRAVSSSASPAA